MRILNRVRHGRIFALLAGLVSGISGFTALAATTSYTTADYVYPLQTGLTWQYQVSGVGTVVREVGSSQSLFPGRPAFVVRTRVGATVYSELWMSATSGWQLHRGDYPQDGATVGLAEPLTFLPASLTVGLHHQAAVGAGLAFLGQTPEQFDENYTVDAQVEATERVTVPAGTYDCLRIRVTENTDPAQVWWLARGIGAVKMVLGGTQTWELTATTAQPVDPPPPPPPPPAKELRITQAGLTGDGKFSLRFASTTSTNYTVEASADLKTWTAVQSVTATAEETTVTVARTAGESGRWFRVKVGASPSTGGGGGATVQTLPVPGQLYPAGTRLGGELFGVEFAIPSEWKGGLRVNSPLLLFGSDTQPGLVLGALGFAGTRDSVMADESIRNGFDLEISGGVKAFFAPSVPVADAGANRVRAEYTAVDPNNGAHYWMGLEVVVHPDGGYVVFVGLTTQEQSTVLRGELGRFVATVKLVARPTHRALIGALGGRSFQWAGQNSDWYKGDLNSSASLSSWGDKFAFFCSSGTMEVNTKSTSYVSTRQSGGWSSTYMSMSFDSSTTEYGQFTVITDAKYGDVILFANLQGYQAAPIRLQADGSLLIGQQRLVPNGFFQCEGP